MTGRFRPQGRRRPAAFSIPGHCQGSRSGRLSQKLLEGSSCWRCQLGWRQSRSRSSTKVDQSAPGRAGVPGLAQLSRSAVHGPLSGSANSSKVLKTISCTGAQSSLARQHTWLRFLVSCQGTRRSPGEEQLLSCTTEVVQQTICHLEIYS